MDGKTVGILITIVFATVLITLVISNLFRNRGNQYLLDPKENPPVTPDTKKSIAVPFWKKWWFTLPAVLIFGAAMISIFMRQEFQQLSWVEKLIGVGLIIGAILVGRGTLQLVNEKDAEAPKKLAAAVGAFLVIVALAALFFGKASVERFFQDVHQAGSNYANRVESPQNHSRSAQEVRCGPGKMHDGVATRRQPLRIMRPLECTLTLQKDVGVAAQIRYNNEPNWLLWPANGPSPIAQRIVRTFEVRPLNTETVYVVANFRHLR